jgi:hypothetical protein
MIQKQLGYTNIQTTMVCSDVMDEDLNNALEHLEES